MDRRQRQRKISYRFLGIAVRIMLVSVVAGVTGLVGSCERDFAEPPIPATVIGNVLVEGTPSLPVQGADVTLVGCCFPATSQVNGDFRIEGVPDGEYNLSIQAKVLVNDEEIDFAYNPPNVFPIVGPGTVNLGTAILQATGWIQGRVRFSDGTAPLNTVVYLVGGNRVTQAADDGSYILERAPAGDRILGAAKPGYLLSAASPRNITVQPGQSVQADLVLDPIDQKAVREVTGMVRLGDSEEQAGTEVFLTNRFNSLSYQKVTDSDGSYIFNVPGGLYELTTKRPLYLSPGWPNIEVWVGVGATGPVQLSPLVLPLADPAGGVDKRAKDPDGILDDDGDNILDEFDNCQVIPNSDQANANGDAVGDACDPPVVLPDKDGDLVPDDQDNCVDVPNSDQADLDLDGLGDACDPDMDNDGVWDHAYVATCAIGQTEQCNDNCPGVANADQDPSICNWSQAGKSLTLLFSALDEFGHTNLWAYSADPAGLQTPLRLTAFSGEALGPTYLPDAWTSGHPGYVFFHYRRNLDPETLSQICWIDLSLPLPATSLACFNWKGAPGDTLQWTHPYACRGMSKDPAPRLVYERWVKGRVPDDDNDQWRIEMIRFDGPPSSATPMGDDLHLDSYHSPPVRKHNYRYPSCRSGIWNSPTGGQVEAIEVAYAVDFLERGNFADTSEHWSIWAGFYVASVMQDTSRVGAAEPGPFVPNLRRSAPRPNGSWFVDGGTDLSGFIGEAGFTSAISYILADGAQNQRPAFQPLEGRDGLLAFESNRSGKTEVYVMTIVSGHVLRIGSGQDWLGTPAWMDP